MNSLKLLWSKRISVFLLDEARWTLQAFTDIERKSVIRSNDRALSGEDFIKMGKSGRAGIWTRDLYDANVAIMPDWSTRPRGFFRKEPSVRNSELIFIVSASK